MPVITGLLDNLPTALVTVSLAVGGMWIKDKNTDGDNLLIVQTQLVAIVETVRNNSDGISRIEDYIMTQDK